MGEQRRGLRRCLTSGVLLERVSGDPASDRDHGAAAGNALEQGSFALFLFPKVSYYVESHLVNRLLLTRCGQKGAPPRGTLPRAAPGPAPCAPLSVATPGAAQ